MSSRQRRQFERQKDFLAGSPDRDEATDDSARSSSPMATPATNPYELLGELSESGSASEHVCAHDTHEHQPRDTDDCTNVSLTRKQRTASIDLQNKGRVNDRGRVLGERRKGRARRRRPPPKRTPSWIVWCTISKMPKQEDGFSAKETDRHLVARFRIRQQMRPPHSRPVHRAATPRTRSSLCRSNP